MTKKAETKKIDNRRKASQEQTKHMDKHLNDFNKQTNNPVCSTFTAPKSNNPACKACKKTFNLRFVECHALAKKAVEKETVKKITGQSLDCFSFRVDSDTHRFVNAIAKTALTMKAVKQLTWNERPNTFYCAFGKLQKAGFAKKDKKSSTLILTSKGLKKLTAWKANRKAEMKKAA